MEQCVECLGLRRGQQLDLHRRHGSRPERHRVQHRAGLPREEHSADCSSGQFATGFSVCRRHLTVRGAGELRGTVQAFSATRWQTWYLQARHARDLKDASGRHVPAVRERRSSSQPGWEPRSDGYLSSASCTHSRIFERAASENSTRTVAGTGSRRTTTESDLLGLGGHALWRGSGAQMSCEEIVADVDVSKATLNAIKLDSLG